MIPRVGETWEIKPPNKPKKNRVLGVCYKMAVREESGAVKMVWVFDFLRKNKGRYTTQSVRGILKYGTKIKDRPQCKCGAYPVKYKDDRLVCANGHRMIGY